MIKNINLHDNYKPNDVNFITSKKNDIDLINFVIRNNAAAAAAVSTKDYNSVKSSKSNNRSNNSISSKSRSSKSRSRKSRSSKNRRSKFNKISIYNSISIPKIKLNQKISIKEIKEYLLILGIVKNNNNCPDDIFKYLYLSSLYDNINITKYN